MMLLSQKLSSRESRHYGRAADKIARLLALDSFEILDTPPEASFDRLTELAAYVCGVPMSVIGFMDAERQWLKSRHGVDFSEVARKRSFCAYTITGTGLFEVPDTHQDGRFVNHPMVVGEPRLRFYAGVPLLTDDGYALGALCVMDCQPRTLTREQRGHLETLAHQVVSQLELRNRARRHATEVSARLAPDATLTQQQRMLAGVLEHTDVLIYAKDVEGRFVMANRALEYVTQAGRPLVGGTDYDFFDAALADDFRRNDERIMASREWCVFSEDVVHPDGSVHVYRSTKFPLLDDDGKVLGTGGVSSDVTDLAAARAAHAAAEERWRALVEQSPVAVIVVGADLKLVYVNPEAVALLGGTSAAEFKSVPALDFVPPRMREGARAMLERILAGGVSTRAQRGALRRMDGRDIAVEFNSKPVHDSGELRLQLEVRDVSPLLASHTALKHSAATDPLTGALNRRAWDARVGAMLADPPAGAPVTIALIDLDRFKAFNDTRGHLAGDAVLQLFAAAAAGSIRSGDVFARWGGEEFIIALPGVTPEQAERILNRVHHCVPFDQTCSIGYTAHRPAETLLDTVARADKALYQAKSEGRNRLTRL